MATVNWGCNKDVRVARRTSDSWDAGAGASDYLPIGLYSGYRYRAYLGFSYSFSGMTSISSAILHVKTSGQYYVAFGSDPDVQAYRINDSSWAEGTSVSLSASNATIYGDLSPASTDEGDPAADISTGENTWDTINVTNIVQAAFAAGTFRGIELRAVDESSASDVTEFYAREYGSNDAYITVTYSTNSVPNAPTLTSPAAGARIAGTDPTLAFTHSDPDSDALLNYNLQVSTDASFASVTHLNATSATSGITGNNVSVAYETLRAAFSGTSLTRGVTYYWRVQTESSAGTAGKGAWSSARSFLTNSLPTTSITNPGGADRLGQLTYSAGAGWASPRLVVGWSYGDAQADPQTKYQVVVTECSTSGGTYTSFYDSGEVASSATSLTIPSTLTEGYYYKVKVKVFDGYEWSSYTAETRMRVRWAEGLYRYNTTVTPTAYSLTTLNTTAGSSSAVVMEYSANSTTSTPGTFYSTVGAVPLLQYFFYKVWLLAWGTSPATSPSLDKLVISYSTVNLVADKWIRSDATAGVIVADPGSYVYGSQSLRIKTTASVYVSAYQDVTCLPNTVYTLSARVKSVGDSGSYVEVQGPIGITWLGNTPVVHATQDWTEYSFTFNSGSCSLLRVACVAYGASSGLYGWFDALKLEASPVVTPWTPGFVGNSVVLDAGGIQVDGTAGGVFRLRGSNGAARDIVDLGTYGLRFGGDTHLSSPWTGDLLLDPGSGDGEFYAMGYTNGGSFRSAKSGDSQYRMVLAPNGGLQFGPGGSTAMDTNLYRSAANTLKTDDALTVAGILTAANVAVGTQAVTPVADTITSAGVTGLSVAGSTFHAFVTGVSSVPGDYKDTSLNVQGGAFINQGISGVSTSGCTVYILRGNTTSTNMSYMIWGI